MMVERRQYHNDKEGTTDISVCRFTDFDSEDFKKLSLERQEAWKLRAEADATDDWCSIALFGKIPKECTEEDFWDAIAFGASAMQNYLADIAIERRIK